MKRKIAVLSILFLLLLYLPSEVLALIPSDRYYSEQWYLKKIKAEEAWDHTTGSREIVIAVIDTGVDIDHPDLKPNLWINEDELSYDGIDNDNNGFIDDVNGWDFLSNTSDPKPKFTEFYTVAGMHHGTIVAGIIAAAGSNKEGIAGISFRSRIMPLRALDGRGMGEVGVVVKAVKYAIDNGADIINLSFVGVEPCPTLDKILREAYDRGVLIVSASGNDTVGSGIDLDQMPRYPVCSDAGGPVNYIIGVAALIDDDKRASFSNYGSRCIDITAPGARFLGTQFFLGENKEGYNSLYGGWWSGTSLAVPVIAGSLALLKSAAPHLTNRDLIDILLRTADSISTQNPGLASEKLGAGRVNIKNAILRAQRTGRISPTSQKAVFQKVVTGAGPGGGPHVRVFDANGELRAQFFAYDYRFRGGVRVATGDTDGDGATEIVTGAGPGGGPHVRVFTEDGRFKSHFFAEDKKFRGGVDIAVGDVNSDGRGEVIVTFGKGKEPVVKVFSSRGDLLAQFFAFATTYKEGLRVASGDIDGDGQDEILVVQAGESLPFVRVFRWDGTLLSQFSAFDTVLPKGIQIAVTDVDRDGQDEIIAAPSAGGGPQVKIFSGDGILKTQFFAFSENLRSGINISGVDLGKEQRGLAVAPEGNFPPIARLFSASGYLLAQIIAYDDKFTGGVNVAGGT